MRVMLIRFTVLAPLVTLGTWLAFPIPRLLSQHPGIEESANWPFVGPQGPMRVAVRGTLSSNSVETIRAGVLAGLGIGFSPGSRWPVSSHRAMS
jgi:DNA-binding transcriptional LysR family regulator